MTQLVSVFTGIKRKRLIAQASLFFILISCFLNAQTKINEGMWRGVLKLDISNHVDLPFTFNVFYADGQPTFTIFNADENIVIDEIEQKGDSVFLKMPVFDSEFKLRLFPSMMQGNWVNHSRKEKNIIPFEAVFGQTQRFKVGSLARNNFDGRWECTFSPATKDSSKAIGVFKQKQQIVTGTFLTETGDYRYLEGVANGNDLYLSCFDGAHAFLFTGTIDEKNFVTGTFYSGLHWQEKWVAKRNDKFELRDPFSLSTVVKKEPVELSFPNVEGKKVSLSDEKFKDKAVIIQIMGSWCPNCMDETAYLADVYNRFSKKGLEIVALAYERTDNFEKAKANVQRLMNKFGAQYEFLITGMTGTEGAKKTMPWLSNISAFPTTIYLNKKHEIVKVYTGYNGPATGNAYVKMKEGTENAINDLLK